MQLGNLFEVKNSLYNYKNTLNMVHTSKFVNQKIVNRQSIDYLCNSKIIM